LIKIRDKEKDQGVLDENSKLSMEKIEIIPNI